MNYYNIIYIYLLFFVFFSFNFLNAQSDSLPSDELQIIQDFNAQLDDFDKIDIYAPLPKADTVRAVNNYKVKTSFLRLNYEAPKIKPLMLNPTSNIENFDGFIRAALGYPIMPYLEAGYQHQQDNLIVGGKARYHAAFDWNQLENQQFTDLDTDLNISYQFDQGFEVGGALGYDYDRRYFYGYDHNALSFEPEDIKQYLSLIKAGLHFKNTDQERFIDYHIKSDFYNITDNYVATEMGIGTELSLSKVLFNKHLAKMDIQNEYISNSSESENYSANILSINPSFTFHHSRFYIKAGAQATLINKTFKLFPDAKILANVYKDNVAAYLAWEGFAEQISFQTLSDVNPFLISTPVLNAREVNYPHAGIIFNFPKFKIGIESGYKMVKNNPFFNNDFNNDNKRFLVLYDDVDYITTTLTAKAAIIEDLNIDLRLNFQNAKLNTLAYNYHDQPNFTVGTTINYEALLQKKLSLGTAIYVGSSTPYLSANGSNEKLSSYLDINILSQYRFSKKFHIFLNLNNITHQKYQRWNGYQNFGFNTMLGAMWKF